MKNFQVETTDGKKVWVHRSIAVSSFIFKYDADNNLFVLANKRGIGAADNHGKWNCPCGYLDWDETLVQAAVREIKEECGITIPEDQLSIFQVNDTLETDLQNVTVRYIGIFSSDEMDQFITGISDDGEENEVELVAWIPTNKIDTFEWAFNHDKVIMEIIELSEELD